MASYNVQNYSPKFFSYIRQLYSHPIRAQNPRNHVTSVIEKISQSTLGGANGSDEARLYLNIYPKHMSVGSALKSVT